MPVKKRGNHWHYDFAVRRVRYRGAIPEARTRWQAEQAEARIRDEVFEHKYGEGRRRVAFSDFVREVFVPWTDANKRSAKSDHIFLKVLGGFFGRMDLGDITQIHIERFKRERIAAPAWGGKTRRPASVNRELACLSKILKLARENGYLNETPRVKFLREDNKRLRYLSNSEEQRLMETLELRNGDLQPLVVLALHTGMRLGELRNLSWRNVDFSRRQIRVTNTKTGKDRAVPMNDKSRELLHLLRATNRTGEQVFNSLPVKVSAAFSRVCTKAGIDDLHFHDLRHTFATRLADAGVDAFTIAALLGHSEIQMTARYTHATDERSRQAVDSLVIPNNLRQIRVTKAQLQRREEAV